MNRALRNHKVTGNVRPDGAIGLFYLRSFELMLGDDTPDRKTKEAIRILRQIGYETAGITVHSPDEPANTTPVLA